MTTQRTDEFGNTELGALHRHVCDMLRCAPDELRLLVRSDGLLELRLHRETSDVPPRAAYLVGTAPEFQAWANRLACMSVSGGDQPR